MKLPFFGLWFVVEKGPASEVIGVEKGPPHCGGLGCSLGGVSGGEIRMLVLETVLRIWREHAAEKAIKAIMRDLRLSREVVLKAIRSPEGGHGLPA